MRMLPKTVDFHNNLADLQAESLKIIAIIAGIVSYIWFMLLLRKTNFEWMPLSVWLGAALLSLSAISSFQLRRRQLGVARHLLAWGILGAVACTMIAFPNPSYAYLLILPIIFASVLLGQLFFFLITVVAGVLVFFIDFWYSQTHFFSGEALLPVAIIAMVTLASWLSVRNVYTALAWVWNGYERARDNEQMARQRQAELHRTLKALDQAYHRLESVNSMLTIARNEAEEARRLKQQFAQNISHELRTPLNLIIGFSETMANAPETYGDMGWPPTLRGDVEQIYRSSRHLAALIDDILDLAALNARRLGLAMQEVELQAVIVEAISVIETSFQAKGLYLKTDLPADLPRLHLDPTRIRQVLLNLLNNAHRFTTEGGVTITARLIDQGVQVAVADTGIGIAPPDVPKVFEEFRQIDGSTRRNHEGTGLGIPLSKKLLELHGGHMWLESIPGSGTTFYFTLPASLYTPPITPQRLEGAEIIYPSLSPSVCRKRVLVMEPSPLLLYLLRRYIDGYDIIEAPKQKELPALIDKHQPVALIVDHQAKGAFLASPFYALSVPAELPVIGFPMRGSLGNSQTLGVQDYLVKPVVREHLLEVVQKVSKPGQSILIVDDDPQLVDLLSRMLESAGRKYRLFKALGGQDALLRLRRHQPDLVLLDLMMPEVDGLAMLAAMRSDPALAGIPVIVISAYEYPQMELPKGGHALELSRQEEFSVIELLNCLQGLLNMLPIRMPPPLESVPTLPITPGGPPAS